MDAGSEPVPGDEFVLRRILMIPDHYNPSLSVPVQTAAVRPTKNDTTGISVYREREYRDNPAGILAKVDESKRARYCIARVQIADLHALGLSVRTEQAPDDLPGHCVIPELNRPDYEKNRAALADQILGLAKLLGKDVVYRPSPGA
jgi:hypothetical protein